MSGVKGKSGRHPRYIERKQEDFLKDNQSQLQRIIDDPACPADWKRNARLAIFLKGMTNKQETSLALISGNDKLVLDKYMAPGLPALPDVVDNK